MKDIKQTKLSLSKFYEPKLKIEHKSKINIKNESNIPTRNSSPVKAVPSDTNFIENFHDPENFNFYSNTFLDNSIIENLTKFKKDSNFQNIKINSKYKTEMCKYYSINGFCKYGDNCSFAHNKESLRPIISNTTAFRTKKCKNFFLKGYCSYGNRCQFEHQIRSNIPNNPYDTKISYSKILDMISNVKSIKNIKELPQKKRLGVFKEICKNVNNIKSTLLEDIKDIIQ